jgi:hypothetical protein
MSYTKGLICELTRSAAQKTFDNAEVLLQNELRIGQMHVYAIAQLMKRFHSLRPSQVATSVIFQMRDNDCARIDCRSACQGLKRHAAPRSKFLLRHR